MINKSFLNLNLKNSARGVQDLEIYLCLPNAGAHCLYFSTLGSHTAEQLQLHLNTQFLPLFFRVNAMNLSTVLDSDEASQV